MNEQDVLTYWAVGMATATALACLAAGLLVANLRMAQKIERNTGAAWEVIKRIREQTQLDAEVEKANEATSQLNALVDSLLARAEEARSKPTVTPSGKRRKENGQ